MIKKIDDWLRDPDRKYEQGVDLFEKLASSEMKASYGTFLRDGLGKDKGSLYAHFPMLINKLTACYNNIRNNPEAYQDKLSLSPDQQMKKIVDLNQTVESLKSQIEHLEESEGDKQDEIDILQDELEEKNQEIDSLVAELEKKGLKVITSEDDLPENLKGKYQRTREIVPLMAVLHTELKAEGLTNADRKGKAEEICALYNELRDIWDVIDAYLEGKQTLPAIEKNKEYSEDPMVRGAQMAKRIARLKENIARRKKAVAEHEKSGKQNLLEKALRDIDTYETELKELVASIDDTK